MSASYDHRAALRAATGGRAEREQPTLSLCIPTWNGAHLITPLLTSIEAQWGRAGVELVIADNGSTDRTQQLVARFARRLPLTYVRARVNEGFDANLRRLHAAARGHYMWFLGNDDKLWPGAIARVLDTIQNVPGALIVGDVHTMDATGAHLRVEQSTRWPDYATFWMDSPGTVARYLARAARVRAAFAFLSNIIFPRSGWPKDAALWDGTAYTHLYACWRMVLDGVPVVTRRKVLVWATIGFPARRDAETAAAVKHAMDNAAKIARLFPPGADRRAVQQVWRLEYPASRIASLDARCRHEPAWPFIRSQLERTLRGGTDR